jgi:hypothetical protein
MPNYENIKISKTAIIITAALLYILRKNRI